MKYMNYGPTQGSGRYSDALGWGVGVLFYRIMRLFTMRLFAEADCHAAFILRRRAVLCEL